MQHPKPETVQRTGVKTPADFDRITFREMLVKSHQECGIEIEETACFKEPNENGLFHLNLLVRSRCQFKWLAVAKNTLLRHKVHVGFGQNVRTWTEGVVYGRVVSEHKGEEGLDPEPQQWHRLGCPTPFEEFLPRRFQQPGFVRKTRLTALAFFDFCKENNLRTETDLWAKATELSDAGDRGLLAYLLEENAEGQFGKVLQALGAQETARRSKLSREALLEEFFSTHKCTCHTEGHCHGLMKDVLQKNRLDGTFQAEVLGALRTGRAKMRNICLIGDADAAKSFLFKGLKEIFRTYTRPEGGTHQLEDLLGKEVVFLNDFEYDSTARHWMPWSYFKDFLEGGEVVVARPKNRGGNTKFTDTAPVFLTAPQEVTLTRGGQEVKAETTQMRKRIRYLHLTVTIPEHLRQEVLRVCPHCTAKLYLEGRATLDRPAAQAPLQNLAAEPPPALLLGAPSSEPAPKRRRTAAECLKELKELKELVDAGVLKDDEFENLKQRLLNGD